MKPLVHTLSLGPLLVIALLYAASLLLPYAHAQQGDAAHESP